MEHETDAFSSRSFNYYDPSNGKVSSSAGLNKISPRDSTSHGAPIHHDHAHSASAYGSYSPPAPSYPAHPAPAYPSATPPAYTIPDAYIPATSYEEPAEAEAPPGALKKKILATLAALITLVAVFAPFAVIGIITILLRLGVRAGLSTLLLRRLCTTNTFQLIFGPLCVQLKSDLFSKRGLDQSNIFTDFSQKDNFPRLMEIINSVRFTVMDHLESFMPHSD